jgi:hypothetical protein
MSRSGRLDAIRHGRAVIPYRTFAASREWEQRYGMGSSTAPRRASVQIRSPRASRSAE